VNGKRGSLGQVVSGSFGSCLGFNMSFLSRTFSQPHLLRSGEKSKQEMEGARLCKN